MNIIMHADIRQIRAILVTWTCDVGEELRIEKCIVHAAVGYLDRVLSVSKEYMLTSTFQYIIYIYSQLQGTPPQSKLQLYCLCCLYIAAKYAAHDAEIPSMDEMHAYGHQQFTVQEIKDCEVAVLKA